MIFIVFKVNFEESIIPDGIFPVTESQKSYLLTCLNVVRRCFLFVVVHSAEISKIVSLFRLGHQQVDNKFQKVYYFCQNNEFLHISFCC